MKKKNTLSLRQCIMSRVDCNNGKTTWITLQIASAPTIFSPSGPQWLLAVYRPQKNAPSDRNLALMKKWYILRPKTNHSTKKASNC